MHYERMSLTNEGNCWGAVTSKAPVLRRDGVQPLQPDCSTSHLHSAKACTVVRMLPCSGYHPRVRGRRELITAAFVLLEQ